MRIIAVSATLPNISDIASFLDAHEAYSFDSSYRPVPLATHVVGLGYIGKNQFLFDKGLSRHVPHLVKQFSNGKPTIVFCHTKGQTEALAADLAKTTASGTLDATRLNDLSNQTNLTNLQRCLRRGTAFHHAGMEYENRRLVERAFSDGLVRCLCATSTLAMGVNLPAHLVVIKGTCVWRGAGNGYQEIDTGTLLQMMGRAGRPGFDTTGTAVIMTDAKSKRRYETMTNGLEVVESRLLVKLVETLNTEISQKVIVNVDQAVDWIKGTFFYRRIRKNAKYYGMRGKSAQETDSFLMKKCMDSIQDLHEAGIVTLQNGGLQILPNEASHVMSQHMIPFKEMCAIIALPHDAGPLQLLRALADMDGLSCYIRLKYRVFGLGNIK